MAVLVYALVFTALSIYRHEVYSSSRFDLGNMDQAVWNSSEGRILEATNEDGEIASRLKNHADFLLLAYVPLYWIWASPYWLLISQSIIVGLGAIPLYLLCVRFLGGISGREWPAAFISIAYLFNEGIQSANLFDFHPQTMAGTFLLFALFHLLERRLLAFVGAATLAALTKEGIVLIVAMMGLYAVFVQRRPWWGIPIFLLGTGYFLLTVQVIIPFFNSGESSRLVAERYEVLGGSFGGFVGKLLSDPLFVVEYALSEEKVLYLAGLVGLGGVLGLLAPALLLLPVSEIAINLLSARPQMTNIHYHYSAPIIPFMYLATAAGLGRLVRGSLALRERSAAFGRRFSRAVLTGALPMMLALWVLMFNVYMDLSYGPLPISRFGDENPVVMKSLAPERVANVDEAVALIPTGAKVSASNWIGPHLAHRRYLYLFPVIKDADYVVVDLARPSYYTSVNREKGQKVLDRLNEESSGYHLIFARDNVAVYEKTG